MGKLKTKKAAAKRFKVSANGKVMRNLSGKRHLLGGKSSKLKRNKRGFFEASSSDIKKIKACLPYA
jgi:large subunit ribosomal protein L35